MSIMSEKELNSYRFASGEDPTDEMLAQIMSEVSKEAKLRFQSATSTYFEELTKNAEAKQKKWESRINALRNG